MTAFFRDPLWQFIGVVISIVALLFAIYALRVQSTTRRISYLVTRPLPLLFPFGKFLNAGVRITVGDVEVDELFIFEVLLWNSGTNAIPSQDYESPISICFRDPPNFISCDIVDPSPPALRIQVERKDTAFQIAPALLNPKDGFTLRFLTDQESVEIPQIVGRINGVREFHEASIRDSYLHPPEIDPRVKYAFFLIAATVLWVVANFAR
jgi:hypothetical protein